MSDFKSRGLRALKSVPHIAMHETYIRMAFRQISMFLPMHVTLLPFVDASIYPNHVSVQQDSRKRVEIYPSIKARPEEGNRISLKDYRIKGGSRG